MNYLYLLIEVIIVFFLMILFYRVGKKEGLFIYIALMSSILSIVMFKVFDILSFQINFGLPIIMGIFTANNIIIQRYGLDEIKRIIYTFGFSYILTMIIMNLVSLMTSSEYNIISNNSFDQLFGYNLVNLRCFVGGFISIGFMLWFNGEVYYYIRRDKNKLIFSNIGSILIIQFIESMIFVVICYLGLYDIILIFGMIVIRYLLKVVIGVVGLLPVYLLVKMKDK